MSGRGDAWKKYISYYPQLLMYPIEDYPYKDLADEFGMNPAAVQHMVTFIKTKPEVIAYIRSIYSPESLPDWVGELEGVTDYREFLRSRGFEPPSMTGVGGSDSNDGDGGADGSDDHDDGGGDGDDDGDDYDDDIADGVSVEEVPVQRVGIVANNINPSASISTHPQPPVPTNTHPQPATTHQQPSTPINNQPQPTDTHKQLETPADTHQQATGDTGENTATQPTGN